MKDKAFLDSNILVYSYSLQEETKRIEARELIIRYETYISTQVLQEVCNIFSKKFSLGAEKIIDIIQACNNNSNVHTNTYSTILLGCNIMQEYKYSFYDAMIIASALESNCAILFSEDLHHCQIIDKNLKIVNPFKV